MRKALLLLVLLVTLEALVNGQDSRTSSPRIKRFSIKDKEYTPSTWRMIHKSIPVPLSQLQPPAGVKPDDYFKFIPSYVGSVLPGKPLSWSAPCFKNNTASLKINGNESAMLSLSTTEKVSPFCDDVYLIAYFGAFEITYFEIPYWEHYIHWQGGWTEGELFDLTNAGLRIFIFPSGVAMTADEIFETMMMFLGGLIGVHVPEWTAEDNIKFLEDHLGITMPVRNITRVDIPKSEIQSGDFLGIIRLDGLDPMLAWGMGSHTGHTAITMWIDGELYVCESTTNSAYWPTNGVQMTPWDQWLDQAEKADYNVVHLPLDPLVAKKFDVQAAIKFFNSAKGLPYGFHNLFTGWLDTLEDNYPPPLGSQLAKLIMPFGEWILFKENKISQTFDFLRQGLNKRLFPSNPASDLSLADTYMVGAKRGLPFEKLVTLPELDEWVYQDDNGTVGPSMVCDVLVMRMWKAGGLLGNLADSIQATEFTNWDAYSLQIFNANYVRPKQCVQADPDSQFCQLLGKYRMALPGYNTVVPYAHMREHCPSLPPKYNKPVGC